MSDNSTESSTTTFDLTVEQVAPRSYARGPRSLAFNYVDRNTLRCMQKTNGVQCSKTWPAVKTENIFDHLKKMHNIDCPELKRVAEENAGPPLSIQTILDKTNICPLTPIAIEDLKKLLTKFAISSNIPALCMESKELLDVLKYLKNDAQVVERHDFKTRLDKLTLTYRAQVKESVCKT